MSERDRARYESAISLYRGRALSNPKVPDLDVITSIADTADAVIADPDSTLVQVRDASVFLFLLETGCRVGEVVALEEDDIDLDKKTARVHGKGSKIRHVMFGDRARLGLEGYIITRGLHPVDVPPMLFLSVTSMGKLTTHAVRMGVKRLVKRAIKVDRDAFPPKFHLTPHMIRHAFATMALGITGNLALVQDLLGHASPDTTRIYAKFTDRVRRSEYDKIWIGDKDAKDKNSNSEST